MRVRVRVSVMSRVVTRMGDGEVICTYLFYLCMALFSDVLFLPYTCPSFAYAVSPIFFRFRCFPRSFTLHL